MSRFNMNGLSARLVAVTLGAFLCQFVASSVTAQTPSAAQIEIFKNLPPDQQQAILETLNRGGATSTGVRSDRRLEFPQTVIPRAPMADEAQAGEIGEHRLKPNDTVLLSLEVRQLQRRAPEIEEREQRAQQQAVQPADASCRRRAWRSRRRAVPSPAWWSGPKRKPSG
jgi:hypothetical protein